VGEITPVSNIGEDVFALGDPGMAIENQLFADGEIGETGYKLIDPKGQPVSSDVGDAVPVRFPYLRSSGRCRSPSRRLGLASAAFTLADDLEGESREGTGEVVGGFGLPDGLKAVTDRAVSSG
jgi:hypothetical protein